MHIGLRITEGSANRDWRVGFAVRASRSGIDELAGPVRLASPTQRDAIHHPWVAGDQLPHFQIVVQRGVAAEAHAAQSAFGVRIVVRIDSICSAGGDEWEVAVGNPPDVPLEFANVVSCGAWPAAHYVIRIAVFFVPAWSNRAEAAGIPEIRMGIAEVVTQLMRGRARAEIAVAQPRARCADVSEARKRKAWVAACASHIKIIFRKINPLGRGGCANVCSQSSGIVVVVGRIQAKRHQHDIRALPGQSNRRAAVGSVPPPLVHVCDERFPGAHRQSGRWHIGKCHAKKNEALAAFRIRAFAHIDACPSASSELRGSGQIIFVQFLPMFVMAQPADLLADLHRRRLIVRENRIPRH